MPKAIECRTCGPDPSRRKPGNGFSALNDSESDSDSDAAPPAIALASEAGARLLSECAERRAYDRIWPHFKRQTGATACGPATVSMLLNALAIGEAPWTEDGVLARGPPALREKVRASGCTLDEAAALARAAGADASVERGASRLLDSLAAAANGALVALNYHMTTAGQPPFGGHHSPVAAYHAESRRFLVLDCWPQTEPAWLEADALVAAAALHDPESSQPRGLLLLRKPKR